MAQPVSVRVDTFGTSVVTEEKLEEAIVKVFNLTPSAIISTLGLRRPIYKQVAAYGHIGRTDIELPWEKTDKVDEIRSLVL